jgi:hypothetical protein
MLTLQAKAHCIYTVFYLYPSSAKLNLKIDLLDLST